MDFESLKAFFWIFDSLTYHKCFPRYLNSLQVKWVNSVVKYLISIFHQWHRAKILQGGEFIQNFVRSPFFYHWFSLLRWNFSLKCISSSNGTFVEKIQSFMNLLWFLKWKIQTCKTNSKNHIYKCIPLRQFNCRMFTIEFVPTTGCNFVLNKYFFSNSKIIANSALKYCSEFPEKTQNANFLASWFPIGSFRSIDIFWLAEKLRPRVSSW